MKEPQILTTPRIIRESSTGYTFFHLEDQMLQERKLYLSGDINSRSMEGLLKSLLYLYQDDPQKEVTLYLNSPGGEVQSGLAVYDLVKTTHLPVHTVCLGLCASMGAILFLSGEKRSMLPHSKLMVHDPFIGQGSMSGMSAKGLDRTLEKLREDQKILREIIVEATRLPERMVEQQMAATTFLYAQEAVTNGYATDIITSF